jgi:hypothetical protein
MMRLVFFLFALLFSVSVMAGSLDYEKLVGLNAEALAETGIKEASSRRPGRAGALSLAIE